MLVIAYTVEIGDKVGAHRVIDETTDGTGNRPSQHAGKKGSQRPQPNGTLTLRQGFGNIVNPTAAGIKVMVAAFNLISTYWVR